jgi:hypothetical protein
MKNRKFKLSESNQLTNKQLTTIKKRKMKKLKL